ncbi:MAG: hydrophobe/amphiphile efflux-3 (HAE3) family transporter [Dehalococcoidia bacterium]|nr:hydrophobe/amphiphile efflux-3 (HAE3) family transporter [Dehalococcoidia bacterium]
MMTNVFRKAGKLITSKYTILIILGLVLLIPFGLAATNLELKTGNDTFVSSSSGVYKDYEKFTDRFSDSVIVALLAAPDLSQLLQPENLAAMEFVETKMSEEPNVVSAVGPVFLIKQAVAKESGSPDLPKDTEEILKIITDPESGEIRSSFTQIFPDKQHAFIAVTISAAISTDEESDLVDGVKKTTAAAGFGENVDIIVTGVPVTKVEMADTMVSSMVSMVILAVVLMLVILALVFSVRGFFMWRWLPLAVVFLGIFYAFGCMGLFNIPITVVTMAVFPILIGLGVDYAIQFHNRYDEEARRGETFAEAAIDSVTHIGPTIGIAIIAACLGFAALFFSPIPMVQDFGLTLIIGVTACYVLSMLFLTAILYRHDRRKTTSTRVSEVKQKPQTVQESNGVVEKGLSRLAPWVINHPAIIIAVALIVTIAGMVADSHIDTIADETKFISQTTPTMRDFNTLQSLGGGLMSTNLLIEADDVTEPAILEWMLQTEQRIKQEKSDLIAGTNSVADLVMQANDGQIPQSSAEIREIFENIPLPVKRNLITDDFTAANLIVSSPGRDPKMLEELSGYLTDETVDHPSGTNVTVTGLSQIILKLADGLTTGREKMTLLGIVFVFFGLIPLFRFKVLRALVAIIPIALIIGWSSGLMYITGIDYTPLTATLGALIIGIGVEFTVLLMMRYYEEREKGVRVREAMTMAITKIGRAICASGLTVIGGFGALLIATDFPILRDFGIVTMINVFFALVATLVVLPPMIVFLDSRLEKRSPAKSNPRS